MLDYSDLPYQWFEPRPNALVAHLARFFNRCRHLPAAKRIVEMRVAGGVDLSSLVARHPVMLVFNHSTHADASIALEATRRVDVWPTFMAAYDVFLRGRIDAYIMQRLGAFSVDREGSDSRAVKQAADVLARPGRALTIFAEGNVYLTNDRVTPFHDGAAFMALRAQKQLMSRNPSPRRGEVGRGANATMTTNAQPSPGPSLGARGDQPQPVYVVPAAIKATYLTDIRPELKARIEELAAFVEADIAPVDSPLEALRRIGAAALHRNLKLRGLDAPQADSLADLIAHAAGCVLEGLERKLGVEPRAGEPLVERVRTCRRMIHEVRTDPQRIADHAAAATWADEAMLAYRIVSYSGAYVAEHPTIDRIAETVEKLTEDVHRREIPPFADRRACVRFGKPIDLRGYLEGGVKLRAAVGRLTSDLEAGVQAGLDALNAANDAAGATAWASW